MAFDINKISYSLWNYLRYDKFFNHDLKEYFRYPEKFNIVLMRNRVVLTPDQPSLLLKLLTINSVLLNTVCNYIKIEFNISLEDIYFDVNSIDIITRHEPRSLKTSGKFVYFDIGIWSSIASYLYLVDLDQLINSDDEFDSIIKNPTFWIELIRQKFPKYYSINAKGYDWKTLYSQLFRLNNFYQNLLLENDEGNTKLFSSDSDTYSYLFSSLDKYQELKRYIIMNNLLVLERTEVRSDGSLLVNHQVNKNKLEILLRKCHLDLELIKHLFSRYPPDEETLQIVYYQNRSDSDIINYSLNYEGLDSNGNIVHLTKNQWDRY